MNIRVIPIAEIKRKSAKDYLSGIPNSNGIKSVIEELDEVLNEQS